MVGLSVELSLARVIGAGPPMGQEPTPRSLCPVGDADTSSLIAYTAGARVVVFSLDTGTATAHLGGATGTLANGSTPPLGCVASAPAPPEGQVSPPGSLAIVLSSESLPPQGSGRPRIYVWLVNTDDKARQGQKVYVERNYS